MSAVLKEAPAPADPILQFLGADVPLRTLLEHGAERLDWLAALDVSPIVMTHPDGKGGMLVEEVSKIQLIERGHQFGFKPDEAGDCSIFCWETHCTWEDESDSPNRVPGIWFVHGDLIDENAGSWGSPVTIPSARLDELRREKTEWRARRDAEAQARASVEAAWGDADRENKLIDSRVEARFIRDRSEISCSQAREEIQAIANAHGVDPASEDRFPEFPWTPEQKHELARVMRFVNDVCVGKPADKCDPVGPYMFEEAEGARR